MSLVLATAPEFEHRLKMQADREGLPPEQYALKILDEHMEQTERERRERAIALLQSWIQEAPDLEEGYDEEFFRTLDQDRLSDRKLFPPEMKGISW
ncbi:MAG: hypothetical protein SF339_02125 [Blastocatellia bacterium]|nr:hypothetical protein [Blastocatellia bacterium]